MLLPPVQYTIGASVDAYFINDALLIGRSDTLALESIQSANWLHYGFLMEDPQSVGVFEMPNGNAFPALPAGIYNRLIRERIGVDPAPSDQSIGADGPWSWSGTVITPSAVGPPETELLFGYSYLSGVPVQGRVAHLEILGGPQKTGSVVLETTEETATSNVNGLWQLFPIPGETYRLLIPQESIDLIFTMPGVPTDVRTLLA